MRQSVFRTTAQKGLARFCFGNTNLIFLFNNDTKIDLIHSYSLEEIFKHASEDGIMTFIKYLLSKTILNHSISHIKYNYPNATVELYIYIF